MATRPKPVKPKATPPKFRRHDPPIAPPGRRRTESSDLVARHRRRPLPALLEARSRARPTDFESRASSEAQEPSVLHSGSFAAGGYLVKCSEGGVEFSR
jgi:hypothetical protein